MNVAYTALAGKDEARIVAQQWLTVIFSSVLSRDAMLARYMLSSCVCPSVRLSDTSR